MYAVMYMFVAQTSTILIMQYVMLSCGGALHTCLIGLDDLN